MVMMIFDLAYSDGNKTLISWHYVLQCKMQLELTEVTQTILNGSRNGQKSFLKDNVFNLLYFR